MLGRLRRLAGTEARSTGWLSFPSIQRQLHGDGRALTHLAFDLRGATVLKDDLPDSCQAQTGAFDSAHIATAAITVEDIGEIVGGNAHTVIDDLDPSPPLAGAVER